MRSRKSREVDKSSVRCALCPVVHGAFKQTTDGRWAHMTCLMLVPGTHMDDLIHKTRIDISEVFFYYERIYICSLLDVV